MRGPGQDRPGEDGSARDHGGALGALLAGRTRSHWERLHPLLEALDERRLREIAPRLHTWPAGERPMPAAWWAERLAGVSRPYHLLAGTRRLGRLLDVEVGQVPADPEAGPESYEEVNEPQDVEEQLTAFPCGATAVGAPSHLRWLALGAVAELPDEGGEVVGWSTVATGPVTQFLRGEDYRDNPVDLQVSPDDGTVVSVVEGGIRAWSADGRARWTVDLEGWAPVPAPSEAGSTSQRNRVARGVRDTDEADEAPTGVAADGGTDRGPRLELPSRLPLPEAAVEQDGPLPGGGLADQPVRLAFSGDGRRVAAGPLGLAPPVVLDVATGRRVAPEPGTTWQGRGPVALDATGRLLAHALGTRVVVRAVDGGAVLAEAPTGLSELYALAMSPDGTGLLAVGADGTHPAACRLDLDPSAENGPTLTARTPVRPVRCPPRLTAGIPMAAVTARAAWTVRGPLAHMASYEGAVLFDGDGGVLWELPEGTAASFTPDGRAVVTVGLNDEDPFEPLDVWFLDAIAPDPGTADG